MSFLVVARWFYHTLIFSIALCLTGLLLVWWGDPTLISIGIAVVAVFVMIESGIAKSHGWIICVTTLLQLAETGVLFNLIVLLLCSLWLLLPGRNKR